MTVQKLKDVVFNLIALVFWFNGTRLLPGAERHWLHSLDPDHLSDLRCSPGALPHGDHSAH